MTRKEEIDKLREEVADLRFEVQRAHIAQGSAALAEVDRLKRIVYGITKLMLGDK